MAFVASRASKVGHSIGPRIRARPLPALLAAPLVRERNYAAVSSSSDETLPGTRPKKEVAFAAMTAIVGAAAGYTAWNSAGSSRAVHFEAAKVGALNPNEWIHLKLKESEEINHNTKRFRFAFDDPNAESGLNVASCVLTRAPIGNVGKEGKPGFVMRPYTPVSGPQTKGYMDFVIKIYPEGKMTQHMAKLSDGETLEVKGPIPKIPYEPNMKKAIGMVAGGSGITPMFQIIDEILSNPSDMTQVSLLYANTTPDDILLKETLDEMAQVHPNFKVHYVISDPTKEWKGGVGYANLDTVVKALPPPTEDSLILVCGPPGMMAAVSGDKASPKDQGELKGLLKQAGYSATQVFKF